MIQLPNQSTLTLRAFYQALINWGVSEDEVYGLFGLNLEQLGKPETQISIDQVRQLGKTARKLTRKPDIGLILGKNTEFNKNQTDIITVIASNCFTVRDSLRTVMKYSLLLDDIASGSLREENTIAEICVDFLSLDVLSLPIIEYNLTSLISVLKHVINKQFKPLRVNFKYPAPDYVDKYQHAFETKLKFNQDRTSIVLDRKYLDMPNPNPVSIVKELLSKHLDSYLIKLEENTLFQNKIRKLIVKRLQSGNVGIESIAKELNVNHRTIYKKLKEENTSYKSLLTTTRKQLAKQYLDDPALTIDLISDILGYAESSAFKRAFKRWFGVNPGQYRKQTSLID